MSGDRKLGKAPPRLDTGGMRLLSGALRSALPTPPGHTSWVKPGDHWPGFLNSEISCCTASAKALLALHWSRVAQAPIVWPDSAVLALYEATSGYVPGEPSTDQGAVMADVNRHMTSVGQQIGLQAPEVWTLNVGLDHTSLTDLCRAIALFGAVDCGWQLTEAMYGNTLRWNYVPGSPIAGGHDAILVDYRTVGGLLEFMAVTWTHEIWVTEACIRHSMDEAWLGVSREHWLRVDGRTPLGDGFDVVLGYAAAMAG